LDWNLGVCLGTIALSVASYVYFVDEAPLAAAFVLGAFAAILGVVLRESASGRA
jgi:small-conductance mechanosensitive channel